MRMRAVVGVALAAATLVGLAGCYSYVTQVPVQPFSSDEYIRGHVETPTGEVVTPTPAATPQSLVTVPDVIGLDPTAASDLLGGLGLVVGIIGGERAGDRESGWVVERQSIPPWSVVPVNSRIALIFS